MSRLPLSMPCLTPFSLPLTSVLWSLVTVFKAFVRQYQNSKIDDEMNARLASLDYRRIWPSSNLEKI